MIKRFLFLIMSAAFIWCVAGCGNSGIDSAGWTCVALKPAEGKAADDAWSVCEPIFDKCVNDLMKEPLAERDELEKKGMLAIDIPSGLSLSYRTIFKGPGAESPIVVLANYEEHGVSHSQQNNRVFIGVVKGNELLFQEVLERSYFYKNGIALWSGRKNTEYRLFVGTTGECFQGFAPLWVHAWHIHPGHGSKRLFEAVRGETDSHTIKIHFTSKDNKMIGYIRLGDPSPDYRKPLWDIDYACIMDNADEATATEIDQVTIAVEISD